MDDTAAAEYLAQHGLADLFQKLTSEKPEDPYKFLVDNVSALSLEKTSAPEESTESAAESPAEPAVPASDEQPKEGEGEDNKSKKKKKKKDKGAKPKKQQGPNKGGGVSAKKAEDVPLWYEQVITKSEMMEYYPVKGCYIYRPWAYKTWELIQGWFDGKIKELGVENCYFPLFIPKVYLEREKDHLDDFAPEIAMVTKCGDRELEEPVAIRPTSETAMYASFKNWIQSHRDLPLRLNQWCSVVRMEVRQTNFFLRHREFLWQEGHTAFANEQEATTEVRQILQLYAQIYEELMACPVIRGTKTKAETFPGAEYTETVEVFIPPTGRALQGATSHHLGQRFAKMFGIEFQDPSDPTGKSREFAYQNSWGLSTRSMAAPIMIHGDDRGLVLPPRIAGFQVVIVPVGLKASSPDELRQQVKQKCEEYREKLVSAGIRVKFDERDNSPGWKFNHWEMKGVPIRVEVGPKDIEKESFVIAKRNHSDPKVAKSFGKDSQVVEDIQKALDDVHNELFAKAVAERDACMSSATEWNGFNSLLNSGKMVLIPFCGDPACEDIIKAKSKDEASEAEVMGGLKMGAKSLCVPMEEKYQTDCPETCINPNCPTGKKVEKWTLFGRSY